MPTTDYIKFMYNELSTREKSIILNLKGDENGDGHVSYVEFKNFMNLADYGQIRAVKFMKLHNLSTPLKLRKLNLHEYLKSEKGTGFDNQEGAFNQAWNLVNVYNSQQDCNGTNCVSFRAPGIDEDLNYGELTDFFHVFRYIKDHIS